MVFIWSILVLVLLVVGLAVVLTVAESVLVNYGICVIDVNAGEKSLEIDGGQSLLSGLIESKIFRIGRSSPVTATLCSRMSSIV